MTIATEEEASDGGEPQPGEEEEWRPLEGHDVSEVEADPMGDEFVVKFPDSQDAHIVGLDDSGNVEKCSCNDYRYRRKQRDQNCKHMAATEKIMSEQEGDDTTDESNDETSEEEPIPKSGDELEQVLDEADHAVEEALEDEDDEGEDDGDEDEEETESAFTNTQVNISGPHMAKRVAEVLRDEKDSLREERAELQQELNQVEEELEQIDAELEKLDQ